jgi:hypothetical protein
MGEHRAATAGSPWAAWEPAMARSSWSWICARGGAGPVAALTGSLGRRAACRPGAVASAPHAGRPDPPRPGSPDMGVIRVAVTCAFTAMAKSSRRPGTGGLRGTGCGPAVIVRDSRSGLGPARRRLMSGCAVTGAGLSGARFSWLPRAPGSDGLAPGHPRGCRHGLAEWLAGRLVWPPTGGR